MGEHVLPESARREIQQLLREAGKAFANDHLTTPVDDNAWYRYLRVLTLDPDNPSALQGINDIVEKYLSWAIQDIEAGYLHKAHNYLAKVNAIDDTHPNLAAVQKRLAERENTRQQIVALSVYDLDHKTNTLADKLNRLGTKIQQLKARITIIARNDAEGRWIYQQLNSAVGGSRIHARIQLDTTPTVKIFYTR